jgi:hypothetical protein
MNETKGSYLGGEEDKAESGGDIKGTTNGTIYHTFLFKSS